MDKFAERSHRTKTIMNKKISNILKYILSAAVAGILLYFSFKAVSWEDFIEGLKNCRWEYVVLGMVASVVAAWLRGVRWRQLLLPIDPSTKKITTFNAVNIGYIANFVFPRIGEFVRCGVITRRSATTEDGTEKKASYDKVLGTVVLERGWDMLSMLILLVVLLCARWEKFGSFFVTEMWEPVSARISFSIWWLIAVLIAVMAAAGYVIWWGRERNPFCRKLWGILTGLMKGFSSCLKMDRKWIFFAQTAAIWGMYWAMATATMWAIPDLDGLNVIDALFLSLAGSLGWLIPVPGGFGAFHFVVSLALQAIYGIPFELGIIFATLSHESQAITMALAGGLSYSCESLKK